MQVTSRQSKSRECSVCGSDKKQTLFSQHFSSISGGSLLEGYEVVACQNCGFCFADGLPDQEAFDEYYRELSKYEHQERGGQQSEFDSRRFPASVEVVAPHIFGKQARILDIGCATGGLLHAFKLRGFQNLLGIDPSQVCASIAKDIYGIPVLQGTLSDLPSNLGTFDLVVLGSVLEHIRDLESALRRVEGLVTPEGMVYVKVPDAAQFTYLPDAPYQEFSTEHINYFSTVSLSNLLRRFGFDPIFARQTSTEQNVDTRVYEVEALFKKSAFARPADLTPDMNTQKEIIGYIAKSRETEDRVHRIVEELVSSAKPIIIWGVGTHTQRLLATSRLVEANIQAFVDSNVRYQGKHLNGRPIIAPTALNSRLEAILISSQVFQREIELQIRNELKISNELILLYY